MEQRVLVLDIETKPLLVYTWGVKDQFISLNQVVEDWDIMAWSAKWLNESAKNIIYRDRRNSKSDKGLLKDLWPLLNEADIVITQNGIAFDAKRINARFILNGMKPPRPYRHIDTYRIAKAVGDFTSHSLEYLTDKLCTTYKKLSHGKYPGMSLWRECLKGNKDAWDEMKQYNIHDVLSTEELYNKLKAWAPTVTPRVYFEELKCRMCGAKAYRRDKLKDKAKQRTQCSSPTCGAWDTIPLPKEKKAA